MKHALLILTLCAFVLPSFAQDDSRIEVKGKIIVDLEDLENITVYNMSSNKGTITDSIGNFKIKVALNDKIKISSVQLTPFTAKITEGVIDTKVLRVYLKEYINTLDEVILLPYDLTGNLATDVLNTKTSDPIVFNFGSIENFELPEDYHSKVDNIAIGNQNTRQRFQLDGIALISKVANLIFKKKNKKKDPKNSGLQTPILNLSEAFEPSYFTNNYNIPENKVQAFIGYLETSQFNATLLKPENKLKLIEYFHLKSNTFLAVKNETQE